MHRSQAPVLDPKLAVVAQEHQPVAGRKVSCTALGGYRHVRAKRAVLAQLAARQDIERAHLIIGVRENDPRVLGIGDPLAVPAFDQFLARSVARLGSVDHVMLVIRVQCLGGSPRCQMPRCITLPVALLPSDLGDLDMAMPLGNRPERRTRFDGLQLLRITHQNDLGPGFIGGR